ncbi:hypothetical protein C8034_v000384 [Colletotrichum sidae]|uniref:Uncharacterized protein n=1 Tax=Colletotrichum sidae TaxID=1347389 RepID=A0A4R8TG49_9PEZI|nr:hypothetical protein C8034_v000384 [Colletotrichum sidae]
MLLWTIIQMTREWFISWHTVLESLEEKTAFRIHDLERPATLERIMFDHSFNQSTKYFTVLHFLRRAIKLINEPAANFEEVRRRIEQETRARRILRPETENWTHMIENFYRTSQFIQDLSQQLSERVELHIEDIKSLQDGVSQTTFPTKLIGPRH